MTQTVIKLIRVFHSRVIIMLHASPHILSHSLKGWLRQRVREHLLLDLSIHLSIHVDSGLLVHVHPVLTTLENFELTITGAL